MNIAALILTNDNFSQYCFLQNNLHRFQCEVEALKTLVHQNICQLYQVYESDEYVSLVMEVSSCAICRCIIF